MQRIRDAVAAVTGFEKWSHADKLRFFAWVLHADGKEDIKPADFGACFDAVHLARPPGLYRAIEALEQQRDLLPSPKKGVGLRLSKKHRDAHDAKYGQRRVTVEVLKELEGLPAKLSNPLQREYLDEALKCFRAGAWRAAIIMAWNLAYDHLCEHVMAKKLAEFNAQCTGWKKQFIVNARTDLRKLDERTVIDTCRTATITDKTFDKCLVRNLEIRNDAAHPSGSRYSQSQAEAFMMDIVQNVVLAIR